MNTKPPSTPLAGADSQPCPPPKTALPPAPLRTQQTKESLKSPTNSRLEAAAHTSGQRRRNSYAASPTFDEYAIGGKETATMTPTMSSHAQFLDPASALRRYPSPGGVRRQLPAPPAEADSAVGLRRRGSSPRILPTPPPEEVQAMLPPSPLVTCPAVHPQMHPARLDRRTASARALYEGVERRPSTGRKLPSLPTEDGPPVTHTEGSRHTGTPTSSAINRVEYYSNTKPNCFHHLPSNSPVEYQSHDDTRDPSAMSQTPRSSVSSSRYDERSTCSPSPGYIPQRKFSDVSLARNGSMAHLLEQQHLLRRELCSTTPDSQSTHSSLSPSVEQLNCTAATPQACSLNGHRSSTGSDGDDPTAHGLDPALYGAGATVATTAEDDKVGTQLSSSASCSGVSTWQEGPTVRSGSLGGEKARGLGLIHCTLQHFPVRKRIRVSILRIEGLAGGLRPELELQPFCRVNLLPAKHGKTQTSAVKRGRNIVFNQEFFFDGVSTEEIESKTLSVEVCHQSAQKLGKDLEIGEIHVPLKALNQLYTKKEVRILEELKPMISTKKLGKICLTTCIEKEARRLTVNLIKVEDLPKWGIIGAPDVCIRITMAQGSSPGQTKSSRVIKNSTSAVYKEAIMFLCSAKPGDLQKIKLTVSVHDLSRSVTGNDVIGSIYLGELAVDKSECEQWKNTVEHLGKEYKATHNLKFNRTAPDVHVSLCPGDQSEADDEESAAS